MIGFIDSGIGGLFVLNECLKVCPNNEFIYLADNKNIPFGNKTKQQLKVIAEKNCRLLVEKGCDIIVFACNTLTAAAISHCRKVFPQFFFIGIEPAILPAIKNGGKTLVLLTNATFKFSKLINANLKNNNLVFKPQSILANDIEKNKVKNLACYFAKDNFKNVVLGCTHYNFIRNEISSFLGNVNFFEASTGVASRLKNFAKNNEKQKISFIFTGAEEKERYLKILKNLN